MLVKGWGGFAGCQGHAGRARPGQREYVLLVRGELSDPGGAGKIPASSGPFTAPWGRHGPRLQKVMFRQN
jgi:hypothetical protein